jgi:4-oxalmesaconate hydratase
MIHVSQACNPHVFTTGSHYLGADTTAFQQLLVSDVLRDFPTIRFVIPHGGGAVPYHWGRFRGILQDQGLPELDDIVRDRIFVDTCVYHQAGIDLLLSVVPTECIVFASEMVGAVRGIDPRTGHCYDDTKRYLDAADITDDQRAIIMETNVRRVYPRLRRLPGSGLG